MSNILIFGKFRKKYEFGIFDWPIMIRKCFFMRKTFFENLTDIRKYLSLPQAREKFTISLFFFFRKKIAFLTKIINSLLSLIPFLHGKLLVLWYFPLISNITEYMSKFVCLFPHTYQKDFSVKIWWINTQIDKSTKFFFFFFTYSSIEPCNLLYTVI